VRPAVGTLCLSPTEFVTQIRLPTRGVDYLFCICAMTFSVKVRVES
jgi:hypothetical protein